jgi:hypothetical protein
MISSPPPQDADFSKQGLAILRLVCECRRTIAKMPRQLLILPLILPLASICEFAPGAELRTRGASCGVALQKKLSKQATGMSTPLEDEAGTALRSVAKLC